MELLHEDVGQAAGLPVLNWTSTRSSGLKVTHQWTHHDRPGKPEAYPTKTDITLSKETKRSTGMSAAGNQAVLQYRRLAGRNHQEAMTRTQMTSGTMIFVASCPAK